MASKGIDGTHAGRPRSRCHCPYTTFTYTRASDTAERMTRAQRMPFSHGLAILPPIAFHDEIIGARAGSCYMVERALSRGGPGLFLPQLVMASVESDTKIWFPGLADEDGGFKHARHPRLQRSWARPVPGPVRSDHSRNQRRLR